LRGTRARVSSGMLMEVNGSRIPGLGLGLAALGRPGYINVTHGSDFADRSVGAMEAQAFAVLDAAFARGVRYFDAARSYGRAEAFLGAWLESRKHAPGSVVVGSKWGYEYVAGWEVQLPPGAPHEVKKHDVAQLRKQSAETREALGAHLGLYQIHSATRASGVLGNAEVVAELGRMKREWGWRMGLSVSGTEQGETLRAALLVADPVSGGRLFDSCQATYNLLEPSAGPALAEAHALGVEVIVKEGMANGRLLPGGTAEGAPSHGRNAALVAAAQELGCGVDALALACVMRAPFAPMVLSGAASVAHAEANCEAMNLAQRLDDALVERLFRETAIDPKAYWDERSALAWQ